MAQTTKRHFLSVFWYFSAAFNNLARYLTGLTIQLRISVSNILPLLYAPVSIPTHVAGLSSNLKIGGYKHMFVKAPNVELTSAHLSQASHLSFTQHLTSKAMQYGQTQGQTVSKHCNDRGVILTLYCFCSFYT